MTAAVMTQPVRRPWRQLFFATAAFLILPLIPQVRVAIPIEQTILLVVPAIAACALAGWRNGERMSFAAIWTVLAIWMLSQNAGPSGSAYDFMARGWALLLAAAFGLSTVLAPGVPFFSRALASLGISTLIAFGAAAGGSGGVNRISDVVKSEFERRNGEYFASMQDVSGTKSWKDFTANSPSFEALSIENDKQLRAIPKYSSMIVAALLALESLAALAMAWGVYYRFATVPAGPPLGGLKNFKFNDQLIWGLAVGATIFLLPPFVEGRGTGLNLLVFFGALYALRGLGILAWMTKGRGAMIILVLATVLAWPLVALLALGLGLGDTWLDWRNKAPNAGAWHDRS